MNFLIDIKKCDMVEKIKKILTILSDIFILIFAFSLIFSPLIVGILFVSGVINVDWKLNIGIVLIVSGILAPIMAFKGGEF